jgi:thiol:disulfide interchange protein
MKNALFIAITAIGLVAVFAFKYQKVDFKSSADGGIVFEIENWEEALKIAKKENKLIFLDVYATWCGPCKQLKKNTFSDPHVGAFYNQNFINVAFNGENEEGLSLMKKYHLTGYPSLLFIDGDGKVVKQTGGYHNPDEFLALGKSIVK